MTGGAVIILERSDLSYYPLYLEGPIGEPVRIKEVIEETYYQRKEPMGKGKILLRLTHPHTRQRIPNAPLAQRKLTIALSMRRGEMA